MKDPVIISPIGFNTDEAWHLHRDESDKYEAAGRPLAAAAVADPGVCGCPNCDQTFWALGDWQRCTDCEFEFPIHAWAMFSWGVQAGWRGKLTHYEEEEYKGHPYFDYGWRMAEQIDRRTKLHDLFREVDWAKVFGFQGLTEPWSDDQIASIGYIPRKSTPILPDKPASTRRDHTSTSPDKPAAEDTQSS